VDKVILEALKSGSLNIFIIAVGMIILKSWLQNNRKEIDSLSKAIKENSCELRGLSSSIIKLEINLESVLNLKPRVERAEDCINDLFRKIK